jgi:hypothetical protein
VRSPEAVVGNHQKVEPVIELGEDGIEPEMAVNKQVAVGDIEGDTEEDTVPDTGEDTVLDTGEDNREAVQETVMFHPVPIL